MDQRPLAETGLYVGAVGYGTWRVLDVRGEAEELERHHAVHAALDAGVTLFDSSPMYGNAERVLGAALGTRRESAYVATKLWTPDNDEAERQIERSMRAFGGHVDIYQVHNLVEWDKRLDRLEALRGEGRVRAVGATHFTTKAFPDLAEVMRTGRLDVVQIPYNAATRAAEESILPLAHELDIAVLVNEPLGSGDLVRFGPPAEDLERFKGYGVETWPQILLKWILSDERVTAVLPATKDAEHARANAEAGEPPWFEPSERERVAELARGVAERLRV